MDRLTDAELAISVLETGSFSAAGEACSLSQPAVSRRIRALEDRLGARLFERTTRRVEPTEAGLRYVAKAREAIHALVEAESDATRDADAANGLVRVSSASAFARHQLVPRLARFHEAHPGVRLELDLTDRFVDIVGEGLDVVIRVGGPQSMGLVSRRLGTAHRRLCASPGYLARRKSPRRPSDLADHDTLVMATYAPRLQWTFAHGRGDARKVIRARIQPRVVYNDAEALRIAMLDGCGLSVLPDYMVGDDLRRGDLVELMPRYRLGSAPVNALFTDRRLLRGPVRAFLSFVAEEVHWPQGRHRPPRGA